MVRRHFLNSLLSSGLFATAASIFYPILKFVIPPETAEAIAMRCTLQRNGPGATVKIESQCLRLPLPIHRI